MLEAKDRYRNFSREELVEEYLSIHLATLVNFIGTDWHFMPKDVPKSPDYWKSINGDLHEIHKLIAERYHIDRNDCLWLENIVDSDNLYLTDRKFRPLVKQSIRLLEEEEERSRKKETLVGEKPGENAS